MTLIVIVASLTLLFSFLCSLFEAALYSVTPSQVEVLRSRGGAAAERLAHMREDVEGPIAAILTVNTIGHTVGAAGCGALVGKEFGSAAVGVFAAIFTVLVLALTEIIPKSLGVRYAMGLAPRIVWPLQLMIWAVWPIVWMAKKAMSLLAAGGHGGPTEDEVLVLAKLAAKGGEVRKEEQRWVSGALRLDQVTAGELRTPRTVVEAFDANTPVADVIRNADQWQHSRVPLTEGGDPDKIIGLVHRREVFDAALLRQDADLILRDLHRPMRFVPETMPGHELLEFFLSQREHMVAVADEYGGFEGLVTLEDVLESFLGQEIVDEFDRAQSMQELALERSRERHGTEDSASEGPASKDSASEDSPSES